MPAIALKQCEFGEHGDSCRDYSKRWWFLRTIRCTCPCHLQKAPLTIERNLDTDVVTVTHLGMNLSATAGGSTAEDNLRMAKAGLTLAIAQQLDEQLLDL